ncbi:MAG: hypothetical protein LBK22_02980 [Tannerella sp.]|jgi:hypothetical protein|nr:hypothetical protein [Tannerella sp.]
MLKYLILSYLFHAVTDIQISSSDHKDHLHGESIAAFFGVVGVIAWSFHLDVLMNRARAVCFFITRFKYFIAPIVLEEATPTPIRYAALFSWQPRSVHVNAAPTITNGPQKIMGRKWTLEE